MTLSREVISQKLREAIDNNAIDSFLVNSTLDSSFIEEILGIQESDLDKETSANIINVLISPEFAHFRSSIESIGIHVISWAGIVSPIWQNLLLPLLSEDFAFKPNIVLNGLQECFIAAFEVSMTTGRISYKSREYEKLNILYKAFYNALLEFKDSTITHQQLLSIVNEVALDHTKSDKYYPLQYRISSILSKGDWDSLLNIKISYEDTSFLRGISHALTKIHDSYTINTQLYSLSEAPDLHFNIVRVTDKNKKPWEKFVLKNATGDSVFGANGFLPSLNYYDNSNTEVWVAFVSNKPATDPSKIDETSIEMFVTVVTSEHSVFSTHMGIARAAATFPKALWHKNISMKLHSFAAKFMLEQHPEKLYMINNPIANMREIILKALEKHHALDKVFIGDNRTPYDPDLTKSYLPESEPLNGKRFMDQLISDLTKQKDMVKERKKTAPPITVKDLGNEQVNFSIKDSKGEIVSTITPDEQDAEFAWFFGHPYQFRSSHHESSPLITCDLPTLASLVDFTGKIDFVGEV